VEEKGGKMKTKIKLRPKIAVSYYLNSKRVSKYPTPRKAKNFVNVEAKKVQDRGIPVTLRVIYGKAQTAQGKIEVFDNQITTESNIELLWAIEAFMDESLWLTA
jgi:hypothetical protein